MANSLGRTPMDQECGQDVGESSNGDSGVLFDGTNEKKLSIDMKLSTAHLS